MEYILLRYANRPDPSVTQKLLGYVTPGKKPHFTALPGTMITSFESDENIEIIRAGLSELPIAFDLVVKQAPTATAATTNTATTTNTTTPAVDMTSVPSLKVALQAAVEAEDWDKAAEYRDAIAALEGGTTQERRVITSIDDFRKIFEKKKLISDVAKPVKGKMHSVLGIADDKEIHDVYTSGKKLAEDLVAKVGKKKAQGMLAFAANINKAHDIFDKALTALKNITD